MNSKGKQQSQFTLILQNVGKGDAKNIEISSDDIYLIFNKHFDIVSTGKAIQSPISLVNSNQMIILGLMLIGMIVGNIDKRHNNSQRRI